MKDKINLVIPAAGAGCRMRSFGPKGCIAVGKNGESIVCRQIRLLKRRFQVQQTIVVVGFRPRKLTRDLPTSVEIVTNCDHAENNVAWSISLGLRAIENDFPTLVVYGDLVFSSSLMEDLDVRETGLLVDDKNQMSYDEVGVNTQDGEVKSLCHGLPSKWAHILVLSPRDRRLFIKESAPIQRRRYFGFEILNFILDEGVRFKALPISKGKIVEVDNSRDLPKARKLIQSDHS